MSVPVKELKVGTRWRVRWTGGLEDEVTIAGTEPGAEWAGGFGVRIEGSRIVGEGGIFGASIIANVAYERIDELRKIFVVFSYGDPMPITSCETPGLAEEYAAALARLPEGHPLRTEDAHVDELPLLSELPAPLRDPENQPVTF